MPADTLAINEVFGPVADLGADCLRFLSHVDLVPTTTGCLEWTGACNSWNGRAVFYADKEDPDGKAYRQRNYHAAQWLWYKVHGRTSLKVLHACDNTKCVRLIHLWAGTSGDNNRDTVAKGHHRPTFYLSPELVKRGEQNGHSVLTEQTVLQGRYLRAQGLSYAKIASQLGVAERTIYYAICGITWAHVREEVQYGY